MSTDSGVELKSSLTTSELPKSIEFENNQGIQLPKISELPQEYQEKSKRNINIIKEGESTFTSLDSKVELFEETVKSISQHYETVVSEPVDELKVKEETESLKKKIKGELDKLEKARKILLKKGDATVLLGIPEHRRHEAYKYGNAKNPLQWINQKVASKRPNYQSEKEKFDDYQWVLFNNKVDGLNEIIYGYANDKPERINMPQSHNFDIESTEFEDQVTTFNIEANKKVGEYTEQHKTATIHNNVLKNVGEWLKEDWAKDVNLASKWATEKIGLDGITEAIDYKLIKINEEEDRIKNWVESYKSNVRQYRSTPIRKMLDLGDKLSLAMVDKNFDFGFDLSGVVQFCGTSLEEFNELSRTNDLFTNYLDKYNITLGEKRENNLGLVVSALTRLSELNKSFPKSPDLFWHQVSSDILINKILLPGHLLSRAEQMKMYGEATFVSAGMKAKRLDDGKYELSWSDLNGHKYMSRIFDEGTLIRHGEPSGWGRKQWFEEFNQLCFTKNQPYYPDISNIEMSLCFSQSSLLSDRHFMMADGWHVFDRDYKGTPDSKGLSIDLKSEPHLLVLVKESFLPKLKEKLQTVSKNGKLLDGTISIDEWITKNVLVVDSFAGKEITKKVQGEFKKRFTINNNKGFFMPSGISAPDGPGPKIPHPLVTYKTY